MPKSDADDARPQIHRQIANAAKAVAAAVEASPNDANLIAAAAAFLSSPSVGHALAISHVYYQGTSK